MYRGGRQSFGARPPYHPGIQQGWNGGAPDFPAQAYPPPYGPPGMPFAGPPAVHMQPAYDFQQPPWINHPSQAGPPWPMGPGPGGPRPPPRGGPPSGRSGGRQGGRIPGGRGFPTQNGSPPSGPGRGFGGRGSSSQGRNGGREGMPGRGMQQLQQQPRQPKAKKQKEVPDTPVRPWRPLNEQEVLDGARWREERRRNFPSDENVAARRAEAAERQARGELDPVREASRMRLREVIARQRDLGLLREAGTADLLAEAGLDPGGAAGGGFRGGRGRRGRFGREPGPGRGGRGRGRSSFDGGRKRWAEDGQPPPASGALPSQKRAKVEGAEDPPHTEGLEGLMAYGSDSEGEAAEAKQGGAPAPAERPAPKARANGHFEQGRGRGRGRHSQRGRHPPGGRMQSPVQQRQPTLLQKLLAPDIRAEHSRLLQCLRFLVTNNFLLDFGRAPLIFPPEPAIPSTVLPELPAELLHTESDDDTEALGLGDKPATADVAAPNAGGSEAESTPEEEEDSEEEEEEEEEEDEDEGGDEGQANAEHEATDMDANAEGATEAMEQPTVHVAEPSVSAVADFEVAVA